jgi:Raf kinase inhibitor-like YbhB/YbcL family protein
VLLAPVFVVGIALSSPAIRNGGTIPVRYTCDGKGVSPPLRWAAPPAGTRTLRLVVSDPDAPSGLFVHWRATFPATARGIREGQHAPQEGYNGFHARGWGPPCPPAGQPAHRYLFVLTALNAHGKAIAEGDLIAHYGRR